MNRINNGQFLALMLIGDVFVLFCLKGSVTAMTAAGFGIGTLFQLLICLPLLGIMRKGNTLRSCGKAAETAALALAVIRGSILFSLLWSAAEVVYIPYESHGIKGKLLVAGLIAVVCIYISSSGIKALARSAVIAAAVGAVCLLVVMIYALVNADKSDLVPPERESLFSQIIRGFGTGSGTAGLVLMLGCTKNEKKRMKTAALYFAAKAVLSTAVILTAVLVCGGIMEITEFPVAAAAQLSQPFPVQRIDALFLIVFSVFAVFAICVQAVTADHILDDLFPRMNKYRCTAALAAMCAVGSFFGSFLSSPVILVILAAALPVIAPLGYFIGRRKGGIS